MSNICTAEDVQMANPMTNNRERLIMIGRVGELSGCMREVEGAGCMSSCEGNPCACVDLHVYLPLLVPLGH